MFITIRWGGEGSIRESHVNLGHIARIDVNQDGTSDVTLMVLQTIVGDVMEYATLKLTALETQEMLEQVSRCTALLIHYPPAQRLPAEPKCH